MTKAEIQAQAIVDWAVDIHSVNPIGSTVDTGVLVKMARQRAQALKEEEAAYNERLNNGG